MLTLAWVFPKRQKVTFQLDHYLLVLIKHKRGSIIGGRTFRKPPYFVPSKPQTAFVFF